MSVGVATPPPLSTRIFLQIGCEETLSPLLVYRAGASMSKQIHPQYFGVHKTYLLKFARVMSKIRVVDAEVLFKLWKSSLYVGDHKRRD